MHLRVGIVGFGVVGSSILRFLSSDSFQRNSGCTSLHHCSNILRTFLTTTNPLHISVWDKRELTHEEQSIVRTCGAHLADSQCVSLEQFLQSNEYLFVSPGIDIRAYQKYFHKIIAEVDLFSHFFRKPIIAITGTVGKTSLITILAQMLNRVEIGGNIGYGMLNLVKQQELCDAALIEVSSFQLEQAQCFAPTIAVWTNLYGNHLDRHENMKNYCAAKSRIMCHQKGNQHVIISTQLLDSDAGQQVIEYLQKVASTVWLVADSYDDLCSSYQHYFANSAVFFIQDDVLFVREYEHGKEVMHRIIDFSSTHYVGFKQNYIMALSILYVYLTCVQKDSSVLCVPKSLKCFSSQSNNLLQTMRQHRLEHFASINGVDFYNDSKATVMQATIAAVRKLAQSKRPILLIVGGIDKGVNRKALIPFLKSIGMVKKVFCFGAECESFSSAEQYSSLEAVVDAIVRLAQPGDQVLFSPSGASFDFFKNYQERGDLFKALIREKYGTRQRGSEI
jgi:UDP-N-acetylmuramoylalanine--D-glutamate ligase